MKINGIELFYILATLLTIKVILFKHVSYVLDIVCILYLDTKTDLLYLVTSFQVSYSSLAIAL